MIETPPTISDDLITKPKKTRVYTPEERTEFAKRMKEARNRKKTDVIVEQNKEHAVVAAPPVIVTPVAAVVAAPPVIVIPVAAVPVVIPPKPKRIRRNPNVIVPPPPEKKPNPVDMRRKYVIDSVSKSLFG